MTQPTELLTIEEFAARLKVGRSTVFEWIRTGRLFPGEHFIRIGRTIRFPWGSELLGKLMAASLQQGRRRAHRESTSSRSRAPKGSSINLDY